MSWIGIIPTFPPDVDNFIYITWKVVEGAVCYNFYRFIKPNMYVSFYLLNVFLKAYLSSVK